METPQNMQKLRRLEIPGRVMLLDGSGELPKIEVKTPRSTAEVYLHGAHITHFQKNGEEPLLFLSRFSRFAPNQAIRGGIPVIFPWFGAREGEPAHGFARLQRWDLTEALITADDAVRLRFTLPESPESASWPPFNLEYIITVSDTLHLEAVIRNPNQSADLSFEICFHTYLAVEDASAIHVSGLKGTGYRDKTDNFAAKFQTEDPLRIESEVDRTYTDTDDPVEVHDPGWRRVIRVEKSGSLSTVVWNPWMTKALQMPDLGQDEYLRMVCVESGNVGKNQMLLKAGQHAKVAVKYSSRPAA